MFISQKRCLRLKKHFQSVINIFKKKKKKTFLIIIRAKNQMHTSSCHPKTQCSSVSRRHSQVRFAFLILMHDTRFNFQYCSFDSYLYNSHKLINFLKVLMHLSMTNYAYYCKHFFLEYTHFYQTKKGILCIQISKCNLQ